MTGNELNVMGLIGILLLIGIVKKNAIMMIDFALEAERKENMSSEEAIYTACVLRFRPIMMTTLAAALRRLAIGLRNGVRIRAAPAVGNCHCRRTAREPGAYALYDARHLPLSLDRLRLWAAREAVGTRASTRAARTRPFDSLIHMIFLEVIVKNLTRRKTRTVLTAAGTAAAVAATTTLLNIAWASLPSSAADAYNSRNVDIVVVRAGVAERITSSLGAPLAAQLAALPEVASVDGSLTEMVSFGEQTLVGIPLHGLDPAGFAVGSLTIASGRGLKKEDRHSVLLGSGLARALGKRAEESVEIEGTPFRIAGIFQTDNALESNTAVAPLADVQELMGRPGQVSEFQLRVVPTTASDPGIRNLCRQIESLRNEKESSLTGF